MNILLTSAGRRKYLVEYFKEALGGEGLVHAANSAVSPAFAAADKTVVTPLIYDENYIPFLLEYCKENRIELLISLFDIDLPVLSAHKREFAEIGVKVAAAEPETIEICNDKWKTYEFLLEHKLPAPATFLSLKEAEAAVTQGVLTFPVMVKPRWGMGSLSIFEAENMEEMGVFYEKCRREIKKSYLKYEAQKDLDSCVLIQEKITGQEYGLDVMNDLNGRYRNTIVKKKAAMRSGETDGAETVDIPALKALGEFLGQTLKQEGNMDVDVLASEDQYYVLELNARFGGGYPFSHAAGANLPRAIVAWAKGEEAAEEWLQAEPGVKAVKDIRILMI